MGATRLRPPRVWECVSSAIACGVLPDLSTRLPTGSVDKRSSCLPSLSGLWCPDLQSPAIHPRHSALDGPRSPYAFGLPTCALDGLRREPQLRILRRELRTDSG